jgi:hypothetical protein
MKQELLSLSESQRARVWKGLTEKQRESVLRELDRESTASAVETFKSLGLNEAGAAAAARGRDELRQDGPIAEGGAFRPKEREPELELPGGRTVKLREASAVEMQVAESFARQQDQESVDTFASLMGGNRAAAALAARGRL